jgi:hypothetical protein
LSCHVVSMTFVGNPLYLDVYINFYYDFYDI